jgi:c-di-GMP-binding flagellar brake protein YcgR
MGGAPVTWIVRYRGGRGPFKRVRTVEVTGRLVDLSLTGAGIEAPGNPRPARGSQVRVRFPGVDAVATVRRAVPTGRDDLVLYGVEFLELEDAAKRRLYRLLGKGRPGEEIWFEAE